MQKIIIMIITVVFLSVCGCSSSEKPAPSPHATAAPTAPTAPSPDATAIPTAQSPDATVTPPAPSPDAALPDPASKELSDLKNLITKGFKGPYYLAIRADLASISNVEIGPVRIKEECVFVTRKICRQYQVQAFEAKVKVNCVNLSSNKVNGPIDDLIKGDLERDDMGRLKLSLSVNSHVCDKYQFGCFAGTCQDGLGMIITKNDIFLGRFKGGEGNRVYGFVKMRTWQDADKKPDVNKDEFHIYANEHKSMTKEIAKQELLNAKLITKEELIDDDEEKNREETPETPAPPTAK